MGTKIKQVAKPSLTDILKMNAFEIMSNTNCHRIGIIQFFDSTKQTASISLVDKTVIINEYTGDEKLIEIPLLCEVPVLINKSKNGGLTVSINKGDCVLVCFNDRDIENWQINGINQSRPATNRLHDITDAIAIPFIYNEISPISNYNNNATELDYKNNSKISLQENIVKIQQNTTEVNLDDKIEIKNINTDLKTLINQLIDDIAGLQVITTTGPAPLSPADITKFNTLKILFNSLLK